MPRDRGPEKTPLHPAQPTRTSGLPSFIFQIRSDLKNKVTWFSTIQGRDIQNTPTTQESPFVLFHRHKIATKSYCSLHTERDVVSDAFVFTKAKWSYYFFLFRKSLFRCRTKRMKMHPRAGNESHLNGACKSNVGTIKTSIFNLSTVKINILPPFPCCGPMRLHKRNFKNCLCFCQDIFPPRLTHKAHLKAAGRVILISPSISPKHLKEQRPSRLHRTIPMWQDSVFVTKTFWELS